MNGSETGQKNLRTPSSAEAHHPLPRKSQQAAVG